MQKQLQNLLQTRMDRKQFLRHIVFGFVAMTGATALLKSLHQGTTQQNSQSSDRAMGYGAGAYGGAQNSQS